MESILKAFVLLKNWYAPFLHDWHQFRSLKFNAFLKERIQVRETLFVSLMNLYILSNFTLDLKVATGKDPPFGYYERVNCGVYQRKQKRKGDI